MKKFFSLFLTGLLISGSLCSPEEPTEVTISAEEQEIQELQQRALLIQVIVNEAVAQCIEQNKKMIISIIRSKNKDPEKSLAVISKVVNKYLKSMPDLLEGMGSLLGLEDNDAQDFVEEFGEIIGKLLPMKLHEWISIYINSGIGKDLKGNQIRVKR